jgi:hypothetical protein
MYVVVLDKAISVAYLYRIICSPSLFAQGHPTLIASLIQVSNRGHVLRVLIFHIPSKSTAYQHFTYH